MVYYTIKQLEKKFDVSIDFQKKILEDIHSKKPYDEKKHLQEFDKMIEKDRKMNCHHNSFNKNYDNCNGNCDGNCNYNGENFFANYHCSNNVHISGINNTNYIGNSSPSPF